MLNDLELLRLSRLDAQEIWSMYPCEGHDLEMTVTLYYDRGGSMNSEIAKQRLSEVVRIDTITSSYGDFTWLLMFRLSKSIAKGI